MSNGFEMCDNHTYLFATEGKDCPYCEIDRLKAELEMWKALASQINTDWIPANQELSRQLAEARSSGYWYERYKSCAEHLHLYTDGEEHGTADSCSFCTVVAEIKGQLTEAQRQLAEARGESERLNKDLGWANKQIQLKDLELDQAIVQIEISSDIARQEAAREILTEIEKYYVGGKHDYYHITTEDLIGMIKAKFRLEG